MLPRLEVAWPRSNDVNVMPDWCSGAREDYRQESAVHYEVRISATSRSRVAAFLTRLFESQTGAAGHVRIATKDYAVHNEVRIFAASRCRVATLIPEWCSMAREDCGKGVKPYTTRYAFLPRLEVAWPPSN